MAKRKISNKLTLRSRANVTTKKGVEQVQDATTESVNKHLVRRWGRLKGVRRFVIGWLVLVFVLALGVIIQSSALREYYTEEVSASGGTYIEGVVGEFNSFNPMFSGSAADSSVTKLIFSSLLKYDEDNKLIGDLAKEWTVNEDEVIYTVKLRDDAYWHDGQKVTADDVVFTYKAIQKPATSSTLADSWRGVEIQALDEYTVSFSLPNEFTPFPHSLTNGILPEHILGNTPYRQLRADDFNLEPIGSGPFVFERLFSDEQRGQVNLSRNEDYYEAPAYIEEFVVVAYEDDTQMIASFRDGELTGITALNSSDLDELSDLGYAKNLSLPLFNQVFVFLNNSDPVLKDGNIREALVHATDRNAIFKALGGRYPTGDSPLLKDQLGYNASLVQSGTNIDKANKLLDEAGWERGKDGIRVKDGKQLKIDIVSQNSDEYPEVLAEIQKSWLKAGVVANLSLVSDQDFTQSYISPHEYQALVFGVTQGVDPDVFPYWHSAQAKKGGFNLSNYKSVKADNALEAGRTRSDPKLRTEKYKAFLEAWMADNPAIALYQPVFNYVVRNTVKGIGLRSLATPVDRFNDVADWAIETQFERKSL